MTTEEAFRVSAEEAEVYEAEMVPMLFRRWAALLVDAAGVEAGQAVLDVACGTGIVAREVVDRFAGSGTVVGLDVNEAMLAVARRVCPDVSWRHGDAAELPFAGGSFDVVLCQSGLMFFPDPLRVLRELRRVVRHDGTVALQVWSGLGAQPAYRTFHEIVDRHAGSQAADLINAYFSVGDIPRLTGRLREAGLEVTGTGTHLTPMRLPSVDAAVAAEVKGTPLGGRISDGDYERILADTRAAFARYCDASGGLELPIEGVVVTARPC